MSPHSTLVQAARMGRAVFGGVEFAMHYIAPAPRISLYASILGVFFFLLLAPLALLPPILVFVLLFGIPMGYALSTPVTFAMLPFGAILLKQRPTLRQFALPLIGLVGGALVTWLLFRNGKEPEGAKMFILVGAATGFSSGMIYARRLRKIEK